MSYPGGYVLRRRTIRVVAAVAITTAALALPMTAARAAQAMYMEPVFGLLVEPGKDNYLPLTPDKVMAAMLARPAAVLALALTFPALVVAPRTMVVAVIAIAAVIIGIAIIALGLGGRWHRDRA